MIIGVDHHASVDWSYKKACIVDTNCQCYFSIADCGADDDRARY